MAMNRNHNGCKNMEIFLPTTSSCDFLKLMIANEAIMDGGDFAGHSADLIPRANELLSMYFDPDRIQEVEELHPEIQAGLCRLFWYAFKHTSDCFMTNLNKLTHRQQIRIIHSGIVLSSINFNDAKSIVVQVNHLD